MCGSKTKGRKQKEELKGIEKHRRSTWYNLHTKKKLQNTDALRCTACRDI